MFTNLFSHSLMKAIQYHKIHLSIFYVIEMVFVSNVLLLNLDPNDKHKVLVVHRGRILSWVLSESVLFFKNSCHNHPHSYHIFELIASWWRPPIEWIHPLMFSKCMILNFGLKHFFLITKNKIRTNSLHNSHLIFNILHFQEFFFSS